MDHQEAGKYWDENAEAWTILARAGYDIYRDYLNTPTFFEILPDITGLHGIDIGCGEGHNTRLLAKEGAKVKAIDISEVFIKHAIEEETRTPLGIGYQVASAIDLPFENNQFDFATAFMSFMDVPEMELAVKEAYRVLKQDGFLQFSILHPCFFTPHRKNLRGSDGKTYAIEIGDYFRKTDGTIEEWTFSAVPAEFRNSFPKFKVPVFTRTLSQWLNALIGVGFVLELVSEPTPDADTVRQHPELQDCQIVSFFLHIRCRKPR